MSDHKFEKQVRQKLGDLKLAPTPASWEKIENEIRERKRRRAPIFWLPLLLLGLGAAGYFMLQPTFTNAPVAINNTNTKETGEVKTISPNHTTGGEEKPVQPQSPASANNETVENTQPAIVNKKQLAVINGQTIPVNKSAKTGIALNKKEEVKETEIIKEEENTPGQVEDSSPVDANELNTPAHGNDPVTGKEPGKITLQNPVPTQDVAKDPEQNKTAQEKKDKSKNKKWSFGVSASGGVSAINEGKFVNFSTTQVEDVRAVPDLGAYPSQLPSNAYGPPPPPPASKLYPGFSFSVGATAKYELSNRFALSAGVNYLQMNTITKVGYKMNNRQIVSSALGFNTVNTYYLPTDNYVNEYKNRYHFIEVPVTLHTRINNSKKLPIYWNAGIAASTLLSSTALHYDGTTGVYYKDDALLSQVQGAVMTGFSFSLFNKSSKPLWIGPTVRYNISPVLKKNISSSKNFMGLGLDLRWYLK